MSGGRSAVEMFGTNVQKTMGVGHRQTNAQRGSKMGDTSALAWSFAVGAILALIELPCTGAIYFSITSMLARAGLSAAGLSYLALYNLVFVSPLITLTLALYTGVSPTRVGREKRRRTGMLHLISGVMLLTLGVLMWAGII